MTKKVVLISLIVLAAAALAGCSGSQLETSKTPFPEFHGTNINVSANRDPAITEAVFGEYDATIVNFWNNGCGSCIEEMPELENYYQEFQDKNINLIGIGTDSCDSEESLALAKEILKEKGVTYPNITPESDSDFYTQFIAEIMSYPTTYVVDREGTIIGSPITGVVKNQDKLLRDRLRMATESK